MAHQLVNGLGTSPNLIHGHTIHFKMTGRVDGAIGGMRPTIGFLISQDFVDRPQIGRAWPGSPELLLGGEMALHGMNQTHEIPHGENMGLHEAS